MRVLFYSPAWPVSDFSNGIISYVAGVVPPLQKRGVKTMVLTGATGPSDPGGAIDLRTLVGSGSLGKTYDLVERAFRKLAPAVAQRTIPLWWLHRAGRALSKVEKIDLIEMEETFGAASALASGARAPLIVRLHGPTFLTAQAGGAEMDADYYRQVEAEGKLIAQATAVSSPSLDVLRRVREHYGLELGNATVIPNSGPPSIEGERWTKEEAESDHVLFIGRFDRTKGADVMIEAFAEVLKVRPQAKLSFVGADTFGLTDDAGKFWRIEEFVADRLGAQRKQVRLLGRVPHDELAKLRQSASVLVHPSRYENFSVAVLEACSQGVPIVASNVGGLPEILEHERSALLFAVSDKLALAKSVCRVLEDSDLASRLGRLAFEDYGERFSPERVAALSHDFYCRVLKERSVN